MSSSLRNDKDEKQSFSASSDQNPEEIVVDFNFKEIENNETAEEVKAKPKRASRKKHIVVE